MTKLKQAVPFFMTRDIQTSTEFYRGLGFAITNEWVVDDKLQWCWLERDGVAFMLQEFRPPNPLWEHRDTLGKGISICVICEDALALYKECRVRGIPTAVPFVGNSMWVTSLTDPDGYRIDFESPTDAPEETVFAEIAEG